MFLAYPQYKSSAYVGGLYVILILRAWQTSHKGQQSLTKLNAMQATYKSESFLLVLLNAYINNPQAYGITVVAFHPEVFRISYFHEERRCKSLLS